MKYVFVSVMGARSHQEKNVKIKNVDVLKKYYEQDSTETPTYFISYTDINKIGINPSTEYKTPIGIYTYPLVYMYEAVTQNAVPFASDRQYIQLVKRTTDKILQTKTYNKKTYEANVRKLEDLYNNNIEIVRKNSSAAAKRLSGYVKLQEDKLEDFSHIKQIAHKLAANNVKRFQSRSKQEQLTCLIWSLTQTLSYLLNKSNPVVKWNSLLRYIGFELVIDTGLGFIHSNEPTQAVFLEKSALYLVSTLLNNNEKDKLKRVHKKSFLTFLTSVGVPYKEIGSGNTTVDGSVPPEEDKNGDPVDVDIESLPDNLTINGYLDLSHMSIKRLPENLTVKDNLDASYTEITKLPERLTVGKDISLIGTPITRLPDNLTVKGSLNLSRTKITKLPDNLTVRGKLNISKTEINELPTSLKVSGLRSNRFVKIDNRYYKVDKLPDDLTVNGSLNLSFTDVSKLPKNLMVKGDLSLNKTKIREIPNSLTVYGILDLYEGWEIQKLPDNWNLKGSLEISETELDQLPENLTVDELFLPDTITELPASLKANKIYTTNKKLAKVYGKKFNIQIVED